MRTLFDFLLSIFRKYRLRFILLTILILSWSLENSFIPMVMGKIVDDLSKCEDKTLVWNVVGSKVVLYFSLWVFVHICCRIGGFVWASLLPDFSAEVRMRALEEVSKKSYSYLSCHLSGDISSKIMCFKKKQWCCVVFLYIQLYRQ